MKTYLLGLLLAVSMAIAAPVQATTVTQLADALAVANWSEANELARVLDQQSGHGDIYGAYAAATRHAAEGNCGVAVFLGDLVIGSLPYFVPAYDLVYQCYLALGQNSIAIERLDSLLAVLPSGAQRDLVAQIKQNIQAEDGFSVSLFGDFAPSNNANRATAATQVAGLTIVPEAQSRPGVTWTAGMAVSRKLWKSDRAFLSATLRLETKYSSATGIFEPKLTLETPLTFKVSDTVTTTMTPFIRGTLENTQYVGTDAGAQGIVSVRLSPTQQLALGSTLFYRTDSRYPALDGVVLRLNASLGTTIGPNSLVTLGGTVEYLLAQVESERKLEIQATARLDHAFEGGLLVGLEANLGRRFHNRAAPFVGGGNQTDTFGTLRVEASHRNITVFDVMPTLYYQFTRSVSDSVFSTYDSHDIGISARKRL